MTTETQIVNIGMKVFKKFVNMNPRQLVFPAIQNKYSMIFGDTSKSKSAINALVALCAAFPMSFGIPFRIIRRYATFIPKT